MLLLPVRVNGREFDVIAGIEGHNVERMRVYDPMEIDIDKLGPPWRTLRLRKLFAVLVTPDDVVHLQALLNSGHLEAALRYLVRGWKLEPGDNDADYLNALYRGETLH